MAFDYENYYRLEYLESSGTQFIETNLTVAENTNVEVSFEFTKLFDFNMVFGVWGNLALSSTSSSNICVAALGTDNNNLSSSTVPFSAGTLFTAGVGPAYSGAVINGSLVFSPSGTSNTVTTKTMAIFGAKAEGSSYSNDTPYSWGGYAQIKLYSCKIFEGTTPKRNFIPAQRISDSVLGLYDEVNNTFYTNAGTDTFIAGPIIVASPVSMEKGISIPAIPSTNDPLFIVRTNAYGRGCAFTGLGYPSAAVSTSTVSVPSNNGAQSWTGTKNTFTGTGTCTGFDDEGFVNEGAAVTVTGLNAMIPAGMGIAKAVVADVAYNAVWNDIVDCIEVPDNTELEYGRAYCFDGEKFYFSTKYLDDGYIGIHSDTAGMFMGNKQVNKQLRVASAGFVLAYVDKTYPPGTPLTVAENGTLTKLKEEDIEKNPHKLVGTFWKDEPLLWWGFDLAWSDNLLVEVKGRKWIKVK